jgi:hypothetical protein
MILRCVLPIIACCFLSSIAAAQSADTPVMRAARFYAAGLERPLLELRTGAELLQTCTTRLRRACSKEQRRLAAGHRTLALLDELTLFPQRPASDAVAAAGAAELKQKIGAAGTALMRAAGEYDAALISRYAAALRVCPGDLGPRHRESLDALTAVDLRQFRALDGADFDLAREEIMAMEAGAVDALRTLPAEDCDAIMTLGQLLMELLNGKLEPWTQENRRAANANPQFDFNATQRPRTPVDDAPTRDVALSIAGNFVTVVATELQLRVFPETAPRIKAIAEAEGIHEAG